MSNPASFDAPTIDDAVPAAQDADAASAPAEADLPVRIRTAAVDAVCAAAIDAARAAAVQEAGQPVGEHLGVSADAERVVTHAFAADLHGYRGWYWAVTVARASRSKIVTVDEVVLLPGNEALRPPSWVPWSERLLPGDLSAGDLLPADPDDVRLVPSYADDSDDEAQDLAFELGLGRVRVLSPEGRLDAAERWLTGPGGPDEPMAKQAPAHCGTCGFLLSVAGSLRAAFGVCANEYSAVDGRVVSVEFGCGAHSESVVTQLRAEPTGTVYDDDELDIERTADSAVDLDPMEARE